MKFFLLSVPNQLSVYCGPKDGGRYDFSAACRVCGTGARRLDPIRLSPSILKDRVASTLKYEIMIPPRFLPALRAVGPNGLREIVTGKDRTPSGLFELIGETVFPPFGPATTGYTTSEQCPVCRRDGYFNIPHVPLHLAYDKPVPNCAVAETYKRFGNSRPNTDFKASYLAALRLILSEAMCEIIKGERTVKFVPVTTSS